MKEHHLTSLTGVTIKDIIEPSAASQMLEGVGTKRVHKDVDIGKDHGAFITSSKSLENDEFQIRFICALPASI
jgi:hypothetical protein